MDFASLFIKYLSPQAASLHCGSLSNAIKLGIVFELRLVWVECIVTVKVPHDILLEIAEISTVKCTLKQFKAAYKKN